MRRYHTHHRFRCLSALTLLSALAMMPLSMQLHGLAHGHGAAVLLHGPDRGHEHGHVAQPHSNCAHADVAVQALEATDCDICDLFTSRAWLFSENLAQSLLTDDSALKQSRFESRLSVWNQLYRSRGPPA